MPLFQKSGISYRVTSKEAMDIHEALPACNFTIKENSCSGELYLEQIDSFKINGKRYGDLDKNTDRIFNTFMDRSASTGVMLTGEKGSGKSLLAKALSIHAAKHGYPTIVINNAWTGDRFNALIQAIEQPCVVLFDEFEKVYNHSDQESMLTLLDGVFPSKKMFVITCNDKWRVDTHMRNRPGRIYYLLDYTGLTQDFIIEYCEDNLKAKEYIDKICSIALLFNQFNFDMLKALVEEMNRYNESPEEALKMLNAKPEFDDGDKYSTQLTSKGIPVERKNLDSYSREWKGNPLQSHIQLSFKISDEGLPWTDKDENDKDSNYTWEEANFTPAEIQKIDPQSGTFIFMNKDGHALTLTKVKEKTFHYCDAFK